MVVMKEDTINENLKVLLSCNQDLKNKAEFYETIFENLDAIININDIEKQGPVWTSKDYAEYLGYKMDDLKDIDFHLSILHPDDQYILFEGVKYLDKNIGSTYSNAYRVKNKDGKYVWIYTWGKALERFSSRKVSKILNLSVNLGERLKYQDEFEKILKENLRLKHQLKLDKLTKREKEILADITKGKTIKAIAADKNLSYHTINTYRKNLLRKLNMHNMAQLAAFGKECEI